MSSERRIADAVIWMTTWENEALALALENIVENEDYYDAKTRDLLLLEAARRFRVAGRLEDQTDMGGKGVSSDPLQSSGAEADGGCTEDSGTTGVVGHRIFDTSRNSGL